jgi:hypothetical protein
LFEHFSAFFGEGNNNVELHLKDIGDGGRNLLLSKMLEKYQYGFPSLE